MLRFEALHFKKKNGAKRGAPIRVKIGHPGRATAKVEVLRSGFWGQFFCAIENTPKNVPLRFSASYNFATSGAPTGTIFQGRPPAFG
jgi:hypothetical protein